MTIFCSCSIFTLHVTTANFLSLLLTWFPTHGTTIVVNTQSQSSKYRDLPVTLPAVEQLQQMAEPIALPFLIKITFIHPGSLVLTPALFVVCWRTSEGNRGIDLGCLNGQNYHLNWTMHLFDVNVQTWMLKCPGVALKCAIVALQC